MNFRRNSRARLLGKHFLKTVNRIHVSFRNLQANTNEEFTPAREIANKKIYICPIREREREREGPVIAFWQTTLVFLRIRRMRFHGRFGIKFDCI